MKTILYPMFLGLALSAGMAHAAGADEAGKPKVRLGCSKQVGDRTGEDKKKFMAECVTAQRKADGAKLAACRKEANKEQGAAARKQAMRDCMAKA